MGVRLGYSGIRIFSGIYIPAILLLGALLNSHHRNINKRFLSNLRFNLV